MAEITFAAIVAAARRYAGLTAAEFDYKLSCGREHGRVAYEALGNAVWDLANEGHPQYAEGDSDRAAELHDRYATEINQLIADATAKSYTGWSVHSAGPVRYA